MTIFESIALQEVTEQALALDRSLRSVLSEVEQRVKDFDPGTIEDEEDQYWADQAGESLLDDLAIAKSVVQSSMGVVMVLLHAHIESGLKRIFKATRPGTLNGVGWEQFLEAYSRVGIDLTLKPSYQVVDSIRNLSNCYKHDAGRPKENFYLPDGSDAEVGQAIDFSSFGYPNLADNVVEFLGAVGTDADRPHCPRGSPNVKVEILEDGTHHLSRVLRFLETRRSTHFEIEVKRMIGDGTMRKPRPSEC